ncbi:MAG: hypothetical protein V4557_15265 [Bacteroidota bacterium]
MKNKLLNCLFLFSLLLLGFRGNAQVSATFNLTPPYSTRLSDYASKPGKVLITLTNTSGAPLRVYLRLEITGNNGIKIASKPGFRPSQPLVLQPALPVVVDIQTLNVLFDMNSFDLTNITTNDIFLKNGLPEDFYQFCVRAYNYDTPTIPVSPTSPSGCTQVKLTQLDPPMPVQPANEITLNTYNIQNIIFSWNMPAAVEPGTNYLLRIIEMLDKNKNVTDAMNAKTTPAFFETVTNATIFLYGPAQPIMVPGRKYAWAVTALPGIQGTAYKNGGRSEVRSFTYNKNPYAVPDDIKLTVINPNDKQNFIPVNDDNDFLLAWNWIKNDKNTTVYTVSETSYKSYGITKYNVEILPTDKPTLKSPTDKKFSYKTSFILHNDSLSQLLKKTEAQADALGLKNGYWYKAVVTAYDKYGTLVSTTTSIDFEYRKVADKEKIITAKIKAVLKYSFEGKAEQYNASNTPVEIEALQLIPGKTSGIIQKGTATKEFKQLATSSAHTDANGNLNIELNIPAKKITSDSIYYRVKMNGGYYVYDHFKIFSSGTKADTLNLSLGQLVAKTYGYSLKLNVTKDFASYAVKENEKGKLDVLLDTTHKGEDFAYDKDKGMIYNASLAKPQAGITVILYRKNKKAYIPPVEGTLDPDKAPAQGFVEVARGKTQLEKSNNKEISTVKFNNLLANLFAGDEYYVLALNGSNYPNKSKQGKSSSGNSGPFGVNQSDLGSVTILTEDNDFVASEMIIKVPKQVNSTRSDSLYRNIINTYKIVSKKAPTSLIKGRLLYKWRSDESKQLRPIANEEFFVTVDYLIDGKPIGSYMSGANGGDSKYITQKFFVPDGKTEFDEGMELLDHGQTMGIGKTDAQGNFTVEVVNFNQKGVIGIGQIVEKGGSVDKIAEKPLKQQDKATAPIFSLKEEITNPGINNYMPGGAAGYGLTDKTNSQFQGFQNGGGSFSFDTQTGFFEVGTGLKKNQQAAPQISGAPAAIKSGPNNFPDDEIAFTEDNAIQLQRVYRIWPSNKYLSATDETIIIQPFEAVSLAPMTSNVKEIKLRVATKIAGTKEKLEDMVVTVFRRLEDKSANLPFGEGDGKYVQKELINPQYDANTASVKDAKKLDQNTLFSTKFEQLWSARPVDVNGMVTLTGLLSGFNSYYIEACANPQQGTKYYRATFAHFSLEKSVAMDGGIPVYQTTMELEPLPSRVFLRLMDNSTQKSIASGSILIDGKITSPSKLTDKDGYAELTVDQAPLNNYVKAEGATVSFTGDAYGYKKSAAVSFTFAKLTGNQFVNNSVALNPGASIIGRVVSKDENGGVKAYVKSGTGKVVETDDNGNFKIDVLTTFFSKLEIIPKDVAYFDSSFFLTAAQLTKGTVADIGLYRRKHRMLFSVKESESGKVISNASILLGDQVKKTNIFGMIDFVFENVSINNYTFIIRGPQGTNYIPVSKNISNEESKGMVTIAIELEKGSEISGVVKLDNKPVKNAKIYIDANSQQTSSSILKPEGKLTDDANLVVAYSDAQGKYTLNGVPVNNQKIHILSTLDTSFTVNGDNQVANIIKNKANVDLNLTGYKDMSITNLFGFPLTVEKIEKTNKPDEVKVTGTIRWTKSISNFEWIQGNDILRVENVLFRSKTINGVKVGEAVNTSVEIEDAPSIKLRYLDKYNVQLTQSSESGGQKRQNNSPVGLHAQAPLTITKSNDYGTIKGKLNIVDNSFNYPETYINFKVGDKNKPEQFYLAEMQQGGVTTTINAVNSPLKISEANNGVFANLQSMLQKVETVLKGQNSSKALYNISNSAGEDIQFKFIEFDATAAASNSYIGKDGKIHLDINMKCHVTNAQPENFSVNIKDVVLDDNKIYAANSTTPVEIKMENWTLQIKKWKLSPEEGGITSSDGLIRTGKLDIPFSKFNLRSDMFVLDGFLLNDLSIGGDIKKFENVDASNAALVFDNKTGTDMKPHWRFSMSSTGTPVARLNNLPGLDGGVGINYIQLLSNDENVIQLQQSGSVSINGNSAARFTPQVISSGPGYFTVSGGLNIGAPRTGDMSLDLKFTKSGNSLVMKPSNVKTEFEGKGFVHFTSKEGTPEKSNITITTDKIAITGLIEEKPAKSFNPLPAVFYVQNSIAPKYTVALEKGTVLQLSQNANTSSNVGYKLTIDNGSMDVVNNDWDILSYSGFMESNASSDKGIEKLYVTFKILGDVSVDAKEAKMEGISTPFGQMKMVFDFAAKRMVGTLVVDKVMIGMNSITGTVETLFDPDGFYVAGGGTAVVSVGNPIADGTYNLGFMVGSYPVNSSSNLWKVVNAYKQAEVKNDCYVNNLGGRLKGFYFTVDRVLFDESFEFDFILVSGYVQGKALVGADFWLNFSDGVNLGIAVKVFAHAAAGMSACTGTSLSGQATAKVGVQMDYANNKASLNAQIDISFSAQVSQSLLFTKLSASKSIGASASAGTNGFSFSLTNGSGFAPCYTIKK